MKPTALIQARTGSQRLPNKVLDSLGKYSVLELVIKRLRLSRRLGDIVLATTNKSGDDAIVALGQKMGVPVFRGSEEDVLDRFVKAAELYPNEWYVRVTGDCPLTCPRLLDHLIDLAAELPADHTCFEEYPNGLSEAEVVPRTALFRAYQETTPSDTHFREHVTAYIKLHPEKFKLNMQTAPWLLARPDLRLSVDEASDLEVVRSVCEFFSPRIDFTTSEIIEFLDQHPEIASLNSSVKQKVKYEYSFKPSY